MRRHVAAVPTYENYTNRGISLLLHVFHDGCWMALWSAVTLMIMGS